MIRRVFWLGVGVAVGVVVVRKLSRTAEAYSPAGVAASAQKSAVGVLDSVREFMADVRQGMAEREAQIHAALAENAESGMLDAEELLGDVGYSDEPPHTYHLEGETDR